MFCENCGKQIAENSNFCEGCGSKITSEAAPVSATISTPEPVLASAPAPEPAPVPTPVKATYVAPPPARPTYTQPIQQPAYQQTNYNGGYQVNYNTQVLTVGQYIGMFILSALPFIGFILLLVWAFSSGTNQNKKNYARAILLLALIGTVLTILISALIGGTLFTIMR